MKIILLLSAMLFVTITQTWGDEKSGSDADIVRRFVIDDAHASEFCTENAVTLREFAPNTIMTDGVVDPFFAGGGIQFFPTDRPSGKGKIYVIAVDFADLHGEISVDYGLQRNTFLDRGSVYDLSDPQVFYESVFFGSNGFAASPGYKCWGANGVKNMNPQKFVWGSDNPADDFKGLVQIVNEISLGKMEIEVECLNLRLAEEQGLDPNTDKWPWFHLDGPMLGYAVQGPADCEDYRQFARLHQAAIDAAYRDIPGLDIEDIDFIYTIVPINAFGHRAGLQGGGGFDTSFAFNDQSLLQRDGEFRHEPGVKTRGGRIMGSGVFGIKNLWSGGEPRHAVSISMHEFLHGMGMFDDYYYGWIPWLDGKSHNSPINYRNTGESSPGQRFGNDTQDLTSWRKFRSGWITDNEIKVIMPGEKETVTVRALSSYPNDGGNYVNDPEIETRMIVIPKEWRTRDTFGELWGNGWNPKREDYNWYDWFTNPWIGGRTHAIKSFPTFYVLEVRKPLGADDSINPETGGVVISMIANSTWEGGNGGGGFKLCTGRTGLRAGETWTDPNLGLTVRVLETEGYYDKVEIEYTGVATPTVNETFPGPAKHIFQGVLTASDNYVQPGDQFTVDLDLFTLGASAVNDIQSPATKPTSSAPYNNGVIRAATPLGVPGGVAGYQMRVRFDASALEYISVNKSDAFICNVDSKNVDEGNLVITAKGNRMVDKETILSLNFKTRSHAKTGEHTLEATITEVSLLDWRGRELKPGSPGFDGVGTIKDTQGNVSVDPLADLYKCYVENDLIHYPDYTSYEPAIFSRGGKIHVNNAPLYTVSGRIVCDTQGAAPDSFVGVESEVTLFNKAGQAMTNVRSDWDGYYHIPGVPVGEGYYIVAEKPKYFPEEGKAFAVNGSDTTVATLQLKRLTFKVSGAVFGGENSDGSDAKPLAGVNVYVLNIGNAYKVLGGPYKTDAQGRYEIDARVETWNKPFAAVAVDVTGTGFGYQIHTKDAEAGELFLNLGCLYGIDPNDRIYPENTSVYGVGGTYNFLLASDVEDRNITLTHLQEVHLRTLVKSTETSYQLKTLDGNSIGDLVQSVGSNEGDDVLRNVPVGGPYYIEVSRPGYVSARTMPFSVNTTRIFLRNSFNSNTLELVKEDIASVRQIYQQIPSAYSWKDNNTLILSQQDPGSRQRVYYEYDIRKETMTATELTSASKSTPKVTVRNGDIYFYDLTDNEKRLTNTEAQEKNPALSPDFKKVAFTRDNDLYSIDVETMKEIRYTFDGSDLILNGWSSWVYYEEILGRSTNYRAFWWSPDSKRLAFYRFDDSLVPMFPIFNATGQHGFLNETRYPKAGDPNPEVKMGFVSVDGGPVVWADFNEKDDQYFGTPFWGSSSTNILVQWMNRDQSDLILYAVNIFNGEKKEIYKEHQDTWIDWITDVKLGKNGFYFIRDFEGWEQIYYQLYDGGSYRKLSDGNNWDIQIVDLDEKNHRIFFTARRETSERNDIYKLTWNTKTYTIKRLSEGELNYTTPLISPDKKHFVTVASNISSPNKLILFPVDKGKAKTIADSKGEGFETAALPRSEMMFMTTEEGLRLPASITYPTDFDPDKKYPVIVNVYGGPNSTNVMDRWRTPTGETKHWADEGVIQVWIDNRVSGHCGKTGMNYLHRNFGHYETIDMRNWGKLISELPYVKPDKIGITGFSHGGMMTVIALTECADYYRYGIAGAGVYNWLLYDTHYTERYLDLPQSNKDGYFRNSVINMVSKYKPETGSLLLLTHGTTDDNVHFQNTLQLIRAFQEANKHFELMIYPEAMHGYGGFQGAFSNEETRRFWRKTLLDADYK